MKHAILSLVIVSAMVIPTKPAKAQFVVFDPQNYVMNHLQVLKQLKELANLAKQLNNMRNQLKYTINQYDRMVKNLTQLSNEDWRYIKEAKQKLKMVQRAAKNVQYMSQFIENRYMVLYDTAQRLNRLLNNPEKMKRVLRQRRAEHLNNQANKVIAASTANLQLTDQAYQVLKEARQAQNMNDLTPMQMRQIQAKVTALNTKQLIELKRIVARYAAFSARKYRMAKGNQVDDQMRMNHYDRQFRRWSQQFMNANSKGDEIVPSWATEASN